GLAVPRDMLRAGLEYLRRIASAEAESLVKARLRAYAIYVLTRNGIVTTNFLTNLHEHLERTHKELWREDLLAAYMASSYHQLQITGLAQDLIGQYTMGQGTEMASDFDTRLGRDAQYLYLTARHFPDRLSAIQADDIRKLTAPVMQNRFNTLSSAYTIMALNAYTRSVFALQGAPQLRIEDISGDTAQQLSDNAVFARTAVSHSLRKVRVSGGGDQRIFHVLSQGGFDRTPPADALAEGLEIYRQYFDANNQEVSTAEIGQELTVALRVRSTGRTRSNVAVIDMLPGGFEVQTQSLRGSYNRWRPDYRDIREDRVVFYGSFTSSVTEIRYRVKLTSAGDFTVPSAYAGSMYDRSLQARTAPGRFTVTPVP
ncbi:MAG: hypothetical protein HKN70_06720, partial [Gammaproteobacteria bacterium]|nr:hypothetical protein [Gammaproteobacteria bacterium]